MSNEKTLILIKPDGVKRRLSGRILQRFEDKGMKIVASRMLTMTKEQAEAHYSVHKDKPFFGDLVNYICSGPIIAFVFEGKDSISVSRKLCGATDGSKAEPGTIRGDFSSGIEKNIIHASDSQESFDHECPIFFDAKEIQEFNYGDESLIL